MSNSEREDLDTHHAVDGGVMHLGDDADVAVLETLDDPQLPQRAAAVERAPGDLGRQLGELVEAAGSGERGPPDVVVEIEVGILDPHRVMHAERDLDHAMAEPRIEAQRSAMSFRIVSTVKPAESRRGRGPSSP